MSRAITVFIAWASGWCSAAALANALDGKRGWAVLLIGLAIFNAVAAFCGGARGDEGSRRP